VAWAYPVIPSIRVSAGVAGDAAGDGPSGGDHFVRPRGWSLAEWINGQTWAIGGGAMRD
jgi:hypothetical protein